MYQTPHSVCDDCLRFQMSLVWVGEGQTHDLSPILHSQALQGWRLTCFDMFVLARGKIKGKANHRQSQAGGLTIPIILLGKKILF